MEDETETPRPTLPAAEGLHVVPRTVVPAGESEVVAMLAEQARFNDNDQMKTVAKQLLVAGYTVSTAARRLGIRATTVWGGAAGSSVVGFDCVAGGGDGRWGSASRSREGVRGDSRSVRNHASKRIVRNSSRRYS